MCPVFEPRQAASSTPQSYPLDAISSSSAGRRPRTSTARCRPTSNTRHASPGAMSSARWTAAGCTLDDVAKVNMYIRDRVYREANRTVRNEVLGTRRPALTVLVTDHWDEEWLLEIEVVAARRSRPAADAT